MTDPKQIKVLRGEQLKNPPTGLYAVRFLSAVNAPTWMTGMMYNKAQDYWAPVTDDGPLTRVSGKDVTHAIRARNFYDAVDIFILGAKPKTESDGNS